MALSTAAVAAAWRADPSRPPSPSSTITETRRPMSLARRTASVIPAAVSPLSTACSRASSPLSRPRYSVFSFNVRSSRSSAGAFAKIELPLA